MRRRKFIALVGSAALAWPAVARTQPAMPVVGWLSAPPLNASPALPYFRKGMADLGYVEDRNVRIEYRSAEFHPERFPALAADLVKQGVSVIAAVSGLPAVLAAKAATATIPIVFLTPGDPVQLGLVTSLNRPGGNLTGITITNTALVVKQIELMSELLPSGGAIAILSDPTTEASDLENISKTARSNFGRDFFTIDVRSGDDFEQAFATARREHAAGIVVPDRPVFVSLHTRLAALAAHTLTPTIFPSADIASSGALMSYGASTLDMFRQLGGYVGQILAGARPADLPVQQPEKIELKINLKTAAALGLAIPPALLARADEVIE